MLSLSLDQQHYAQNERTELQQQKKKKKKSTVSEFLLLEKAVKLYTAMRCTDHLGFQHNKELK